MPSGVVAQQLSQEINDFSRGNPLVMQTEHQTTPRADRRQRRDAATFPGDRHFPWLSSDGPCLAQEGGQGNRCLVLAVQNRPEISERSANLGEGFLLPAFPLYGVRLEVLPLGSLPGQPCVPQASPHRIFGNGFRKAVGQNLVEAVYCPQIAFKAVTRGGSQ